MDRYTQDVVIFFYKYQSLIHNSFFKFRNILRMKSNIHNYSIFLRQFPESLLQLQNRNISSDKL